MSRDFLLQIFFIFPQALENYTRVISNFFKNSRRYSQVKVKHRFQWHRQQILPPVPLVLLIPGANDTGGKFDTGVNDTAGKWELYQTTGNLK
jgi:hypothetical protein